MKKDLIFTPVLLIIAVILFLLKTTGLGAHIAVSIIGVLVLGVYTSLTRTEWKIPALEIIMRAFYGIALISGVVVMNVKNVPAVAIAHKVSGYTFAALLVVLLVIKLVTRKKG